MEPDAQTIRRLAQETRFQAPRLEKVIRITTFIAEVARHHALGDKLCLKGGTALNVYHLDMPRLSVDADFNYQARIDAKDLALTKDAVEKSLDDIAKALGYTLDPYQDSHALCAYLLRYKSTLGHNDHIKLDINYIERVPILEPVRMRPPAWLPVADTPVAVLDLNELAGSKIATLMIRGASRDLFDTANLTTLEIDEDLAACIAVFHGFLDNLGLTTLKADRMEYIKAADFQRTLQDLLPKRSEYASMRPDEALGALQDAARPLVAKVMEVPRIDECRRSLAQRAWQPKDLFGDLEVNENLVHHPGIAWRFRQAR